MSSFAFPQEEEDVLALVRIADLDIEPDQTTVKHIERMWQIGRYTVISVSSVITIPMETIIPFLI